MKYHGQLSKWLHCREDSIVNSSQSHMNESMDLKRDKNMEEKTKVVRADDVIEESMWKN